MNQESIREHRHLLKKHDSLWIHFPKSTAKELLNNAEMVNAMTWARRTFGGMKSCLACPMQDDHEHCQMECDDIVRYKKKWFKAYITKEKDNG